MKRAFAFLSLFTSAGTLLCCALPALFVTLGFGAAFAGIVSNVPQLIWLSENKILLFVVGAVLLMTGGILQWRARNNVCRPAPDLTQACTSTRDWSSTLYLISVGTYFVGAFFAFIAPYIYSV